MFTQLDKLFSNKKRLAGVTIICIFFWLNGFFNLYWGGVGIYYFIRHYLGFINIATSSVPNALMIIVVGAIAQIILGISKAISFYWLWFMKRKGWLWSIIVLACELIFVIFMSSTIQIISNFIFNGIAIAYLWTKRKMFK